MTPRQVTIELLKQEGFQLKREGKKHTDLLESEN